MVTETNTSHIWYQEGAGKRFAQAEQAEFNKILPTLYGYHLLFLGEPALASLVTSSLISHRILVNPSLKGTNDSISNLTGALDALPLRSDSIDVVVLSHTLEQTLHPHEVLRETHRILIPEGHLVITGFNPISMWGMWYATKKLVGNTSRQGKMLSPNRVKDWLKLLNFQIIDCRMFYFRPPLDHDSLNQKLKFMEKWGEHCWPFLGGAYSIVAVKRVIPLTPIKAKWRSELIWQGNEGLKPTASSYQQEKDL
ncbi:MAG: methyltransferase domain-containing protein [Proteobacteria bacterium]|nr:methyltransferase domain-containing protein [Pseudomonadota bacterium]